MFLKYFVQWKKSCFAQDFFYPALESLSGFCCVTHFNVLINIQQTDFNTHKKSIRVYLQHKHQYEEKLLFNNHTISNQLCCNSTSKTWFFCNDSKNACRYFKIFFATGSSFKLLFKQPWILLQKRIAGAKCSENSAALSFGKCWIRRRHGRKK